MFEYVCATVCVRAHPYVRIFINVILACKCLTEVREEEQGKEVVVEEEEKQEEEEDKEEEIKYFNDTFNDIYIFIYS